MEGNKPGNLESLKPAHPVERRWRERLNLRDELLLALLPTVIVLLTLGLVEVFSSQRLLFASLASSAFLIYVDPQHGMNRIRALVIAQLGAAAIGLLFFLVVGSGYVSGGAAMIVTITLMILFDVVHPPAVSTALSFAFRSGDASNLLIFAMSVAMVAVLVLLQLTSVRLLTKKRVQKTRE